MRHVAALMITVVVAVGLASCKSTPRPATGNTPESMGPGSGSAGSGTGHTPEEARRPKVVGSVVAVVNNDIVTREEILKALGPEFEKLEKDLTLSDRGRAEKRTQLVREEVQRRVDHLLILQEAKRKLKDEEVTRIDHEVDDYMRGLVRKYHSKEELDKELAKDGKTYASKRTEVLEDRMIATLLDQEIGRHTYVRPAEMAAYYEAHRDSFHQKRAIEIRQIFLSFSESESGYVDKEFAHARGLKMLERLRQGEDFGHLAKDYGKGPNVEQGGLWPGYIEEGSGELRPEVERVAFKMEIKQVSPLIESEIGYHIIKVEDIRAERDVPYPEVQEDISKILRKEKMEASRRELIGRVQKNSYVQVQKTWN